MSKVLVNGTAMNCAMTVSAVPQYRTGNRFGGNFIGCSTSRLTMAIIRQRVALQAQHRLRYLK